MPLLSRTKYSIAAHANGGQSVIFAICSDTKFFRVFDNDDFDDVCHLLSAKSCCLLFEIKRTSVQIVTHIVCKPNAVGVAIRWCSYYTVGLWMLWTNMNIVYSYWHNFGTSFANVIKLNCRYTARWYGILVAVAATAGTSFVCVVLLCISSQQQNFLCD